MHLVQYVLLSYEYCIKCLKYILNIYDKKVFKELLRLFYRRKKSFTQEDCHYQVVGIGEQIGMPE